jgi:hypothetical protein
VRRWARNGPPPPEPSSAVFGPAPPRPASVSARAGPATGVGSRYWTYKNRDSGGVREMVLFAAINAVAIAIQASVVALTFYVLHITSKVENFSSEFVLAIGIGMVFRFWCYRTFIFPEAETALASDEFQYSEPLQTSELKPEVPGSSSGELLRTRGRQQEVSEGPGNRRHQPTAYGS